MSEKDDPTSRAERGERSRTSAAKARVNDTREAEERPIMDHWSPANVLETPPQKDGYAYRWIAEYVNGTHVPRNVQMALREGYVRVTISELPDDFLVDEDMRGDNYARTGGLILMKLPLEFARQQRKYYRQRMETAVAGANQLQGVSGAFPQLSEDRGSRVLTGTDAERAINRMNTG